eukprot:m.59481 g.59481  ORF g.59481 m.59481 type:complete len:719 (+) comp7892_c0_seq1:444-2600(+)
MATVSKPDVRFKCIVANNGQNKALILRKPILFETLRDKVTSAFGPFTMSYSHDQDDAMQPLNNQSDLDAAVRRHMREPGKLSMRLILHPKKPNTASLSKPASAMDVPFSPLRPDEPHDWGASLRSVNTAQGQGRHSPPSPPPGSFDHRRIVATTTSPGGGGHGHRRTGSGAGVPAHSEGQFIPESNRTRARGKEHALSESYHGFSSTFPRTGNGTFHKEGDDDAESGYGGEAFDHMARSKGNAETFPRMYNKVKKTSKNPASFPGRIRSSPSKGGGAAGPASGSTSPVRTSRGGGGGGGGPGFGGMQSLSHALGEGGASMMGGSEWDPGFGGSADRLTRRVSSSSSLVTASSASARHVRERSDSRSGARSAGPVVDHPGYRTVDNGEGAATAGGTGNGGGARTGASTGHSSGGAARPRAATASGVPSSSSGATATAAANSIDSVARGEWQKGKFLGSGAFGQVFLAHDAKTGRDFAIKQVFYSSENGSSSREVESLEREIKLLKSLRHPRIVQYYNTHRTPQFLAIFMEYVPGRSVHARLKEYGAFQDELVRKYTRQVLEGLAYLHSEKVIHRDIKGANVLADAQGSVKLADFGASKKLQSIKSMMSSNHKSVHGTPYWMSPEAITGTHGGYGFSSDIWSTGALVVEMLTTNPPFWTFEPVTALFKIGQAKKPADLKEMIPPNIHPQAEAFLWRCFQLRPQDRPTASRLLADPYVTQP